MGARFQFSWPWRGAALVVMLGYLIPYGPMPIPSFYTELAAWVGWILICSIVFSTPRVWLRANRDVGLLLIPFMLVVGALLLQLLFGVRGERIVYPGNSIYAVAYICFGALLAALAANTNTDARRDGVTSGHAQGTLDQLVTSALIVGAGLAGMVAWCQYLKIEVAYLVAPLSTEGRVYGNLRQPNHQALFLFMGLACLLRQILTSVSVKLHHVLILIHLIGALALTSSKTSIALMALLIIWALSHREPKGIKVALLALGIYAMWIVFFSAARSWIGLDHYGLTRYLTSGEDLTNTRAEIWRITVVAIKESIVVGYGFGQFALSHQLNPSIDKAFEGLTNAHSTPLQLALDIGLLPTIAVIVSLGVVLVRSLSISVLRDFNVWLVMLSGIFAYALIEYPLWYAYFFFPACWFLGRIASHRVARVEPFSQPQTKCFGVHSRFRLAWNCIFVLSLVIAATLEHGYKKIISFYILDSDRSRDVLSVSTAGIDVWLYEAWIDRATIEAVPLTQDNLPVMYQISRRASVHFADFSVLFNRALIASMLGNDRECEFLLRRLAQMTPERLRSQVSRLDQIDDPTIRVFTKRLVTTLEQVD